MLALGFLVEGGEDIVFASIAGMLAGLVAASRFRRFCYEMSQADATGRAAGRSD